MSDDTPTQRIPGPDDDAPTQRLDAAVEAAVLRDDLEEERTRSKGLLIGLISAAALLLVAIIVLVVILLPRGSGDQAPIAESPAPSESAEPTPEPTLTDEPATPEPSPTPTQPPANPPANPPATTPRIDSFSVSPSTWTCNTQAPNPVPDPKLTFTWSTTNATRVYFAVGSTNDAESNGQGWMNLPVDGTSADFPDNTTFYFFCPAASQSYTLTAKDDKGNKVSKTITVVNNGDKQ